MRQKPLLRTGMPDQGLRLKKGNVMVYPKYSAEGPPVSPIKGLRLWERAGLPKIRGGEDLGLLEDLTVHFLGATKGAEG